MIATRRFFATAALRFRESARGPVAGFLLLFLAAGAAAALLIPGDDGLERQRAVDGAVLDAALLVAVLFAAACGAGGLPADREAGREDRLAAAGIRPLDLLAGGMLGHAAALALFAAAAFAAVLPLTGILSGGAANRSATRAALRATELLDHRGRPAAGPVRLTEEAPEATYRLPFGRAAVADPDRADPPRAFLAIEERYDAAAGIPETWPALVKVGAGPWRQVLAERGRPLSFAVPPEDVDPAPGTPVTIRRVAPDVELVLRPGALVVEGRPRSIAVDLLLAAGAWWGALLVAAAAAAALSTVVGAPIAAAGGLIAALIGRSLDVLREAAAYLQQEGHVAAAKVLSGFAAVWPDFDAADFTRPVTARWAIDADLVLAALPGLLAAAAVFVAAGVFVQSRRRR